VVVRRIVPFLLNREETTPLTCDNDSTLRSEDIKTFEPQRELTESTADAP
jgi:hypothetical protein